MIDCIALRPSRYILRYMIWRASLSYGMVESGYNPNLTIIEISQIYSNTGQVVSNKVEKNGGEGVFFTHSFMTYKVWSSMVIQPDT